MSKSGDGASSGLVAILMVGIAVAYFAWPSIVRLTADHAAGDVAIWIYDNDVAPGETIDGRARIDRGEQAAITAVVVRGAGHAQETRGEGRSWGGVINARKYDSASASEDFAFKIPGDVAPGTVLHLAIEVDHLTANRDFLGSFTNEYATTTIHHDVMVHSTTASVLRRAGKTALALGSWLAIAAGLVATARCYARRRRQASDAWMLMLIPYAFMGFVWFAELLEQATRLHGWWFVTAALVLWFGVFVVQHRLTRYAGMRRYRVTQAAVPSAGNEPYRAAGVELPIKSLADLEAAWLTIGLLTRRDGARLIVSPFGGGKAAIVPVPPSEAFGGEPFEILATDHDLVLDMIGAAAAILGELRGHAEGEREFRIARQAMLPTGRGGR